MSSPLPENSSNQQMHHRSNTDQTNLPVSCRPDLGLPKSSSQSSLSEPSPLTLEETKHSPHLCKSRRSVSSSSIKSSEEPAAFGSHVDSNTLHPALTSPTSMTTDSPIKNRVFPVPKVLIPPTPSCTQTSSPENARRSKPASLAPVAESSRSKIILVVLKNSVPKTENSQSKGRQMGGERTGDEVVDRPGCEKSTGVQVGSQEGRDEVGGDEGVRENGEAEKGGGDAEDWEWIG